MYKRLLAFASLVLSLTTVDSRAVRDITTADLTVHVAAPNVARDAGDFVVNTTIANIGAQTIYLLKHSGVFRPHTKNFAIVDSFGNAAKFTGIKAKWSPDVAAKGHDTTVILAPGDVVTISHDLTEAYDLSGLKRGANATVQLLKYSPVFYLVDRDTRDVTPTAATVVYEHADIEIAHTVVFPVAQPANLARAVQAPMAGCTAAEVATINATIPSTVSSIAASNTYLLAQGAGSVYTRWFGVSDPDRLAVVQAEFTKMGGNNFTGFTYNCHASAPDCDPGDYAYVDADIYGVIYLCDEFFNSPVTGYDSRASTLVHEASHFNVNGGTDDIAYGTDDCLNLAEDNPDQAVDNASNYEYFSVDA